MKISVVMACFNEEDVIGRQLDALARQRFDGDFEVVVADNGSTDGSRAVVEASRGRLSALSWVDASDRRGASHARNVGVRASRGELLAFCDADDEVADGWLAAMAAAIERDGFVACRLENRKLNHHWWAKHRGCAQLTGLQSGLVHPTLPYAGGGTLGIRRSLHDAVGGFDEGIRFHEDTDYCLRVQEETGVALKYVADAVIHVSWPVPLLDGFEQLRRWSASRVDVQRRHWPEFIETLGVRGQAERFARHCARLRRVRNEEGLVRWLMTFGTELGTLQGFVRERMKGH